MEEIVDTPPSLTISVVSHGQLHLIESLLQDIQTHCQAWSIVVVLTLNVPESLNFDVDGFFYPVRIIKNTEPKGFGENHNQAFQAADGDYFCIVNPDIRFDRCPFSDLLACLSDTRVGVVAPRVTGPTGQDEDSARRFPSPQKIIQKVFSRKRPTDYPMVAPRISVDWVGGMFMVFPQAVFKKLKGFDTGYFLYYEDVDLCARVGLSGLNVLLCTSCCVVHHAQRSSHRSFKFLRWHLTSMLRFFLSPVYRQIRRAR